MGKNDKKKEKGRAHRKSSQEGTCSDKKSFILEYSPTSMTRRISWKEIFKNILEENEAYENSLKKYFFEVIKPVTSKEISKEEHLRNLLKEIYKEDFKKIDFLKTQKALDIFNKAAKKQPSEKILKIKEHIKNAQDVFKRLTHQKIHNATDPILEEALKAQIINLKKENDELEARLKEIEASHNKFDRREKPRKKLTKAKTSSESKGKSYSPESKERTLGHF